MCVDGVWASVCTVLVDGSVHVLLVSLAAAVWAPDTLTANSGTQTGAETRPFDAVAVTPSSTLFLPVSVSVSTSTNDLCAAVAVINSAPRDCFDIDVLFTVLTSKGVHA